MKPTRRTVPVVRSMLRPGSLLLLPLVLVLLSSLLSVPIFVVDAYSPPPAAPAMASSSDSNSNRPTAATLREEDVVIEGSGGVRLAAKVCNRRSPVAVVLAHPYGPLGGNMMNNVVVKLTQSLAREGFTTLRFNARGGRTSWRGLKEKEDVACVCRYALSQLEQPPTRLILIGYSHGSVVSSAVAGELPEVLAYAAIAYPFSVAWALTLFHQGSFLVSASQGSKPKLFLMGTQDQFTGVGVFRSRVNALPGPLEVVEVKGCDHFFFGREGFIFEAVQSWLQRVLGTADLKALTAKPPSTEIRVAEAVPDAHREL